MKCKCCSAIGGWTIVGRNGRGVVCGVCNKFLVTALDCPEDRITKLARAVISGGILDLLYYRRHKSGHKMKSWRRKREIIEAGQVAETFFGDLYGSYTWWCSLAGLPPLAAKKKIASLTEEEVNKILNTWYRKRGEKNV